MSATAANGRFAIVGAGISGLRCAAVLLESGANVTVFEARDRIGGRITQSSALGWPIDIGANWVHSTEDNPILQLARETGTPLHEWDPCTILIDASGQVVESERANNVLAKVWDILEDALEYSKEHGVNIRSEESLYNFFEGRSMQMVRDAILDVEDRDLVLGMSAMWGAYVGDGVDRQSLKFFLLEDCVNENDCFIPTSYKDIMERASEGVLRQANVRLGARMTSVSTSSDTAATVKVHLEDGTEHEFDHVVITCPLGWLKRNSPNIPLSPRLKTAVQSISFGRLEKVFIEFPRAFWDEGEEKPISFAHWLTPAYATDTNPSRWRLETVSLAAVPEQYRHPMLLFYTFGDCSSHVVSSIYGRSLSERNAFLKAFFEPYYSRLPHFDAATCQPTAFLATEWCADELAGFGSYCNFQVGMTDAAADVECLRAGMPAQHIWFAGEHTAPTDGLGTVSGAYNSGERAARQVVEAWVGAHQH